MRDAVVIQRPDHRVGRVRFPPPPFLIIITVSYVASVRQIRPSARMFSRSKTARSLPPASPSRPAASGSPRSSKASRFTQPSTSTPTTAKASRNSGASWSFHGDHGDDDAPHEPEGSRTPEDDPGGGGLISRGTSRTAAERTARDGADWLGAPAKQLVGRIVAQATASEYAIGAA